MYNPELKHTTDAEIILAWSTMMKDKSDNKRQQVRIVFFISLLFYLWLAAQIPYCQDDWDWGLPIGIQQLTDASLNSRYVGNLIEVALTRSSILKTIVMGLTFAVIPFSAARAVTQCGFEDPGTDYTIPAALLASILMLSMPLEIWRQTFGWVAGFSNFVVSALLLLEYQMLLISLLREKRKKQSLFQTIAVFLFAIALQLFLENVAVYIFLCSSIVLFASLWRKKGNRDIVGLWAGNLIGTVIMFSSSVYLTLAETGSAIDGYRTLSFDREASLFSIVFGFFRRFVILYPDQIWMNNTVLCCAILLLLIVLHLIKKNTKSCFVWCTVDLLLFVYTVFCSREGRIQLPSEWWTNVLSAGIAIVFFVVVLFQAFFVFRNQRTPMQAFLFFWISAPAVVLPMVVVSSVGPRTFLTSNLFLIEASLLLFLEMLRSVKPHIERSITVLLSVALGALWLYGGVVYYGIGNIRRDRLDAISSARAGETQSILLKAFPHGEFLWSADPEYGSERVEFYRAFYGIPENTPFWFETWVDDE